MPPMAPMPPMFIILAAAHDPKVFGKRLPENLMPSGVLHRRFKLSWCLLTAEHHALGAISLHVCRNAHAILTRQSRRI